jgi:hypothetical protein
LGIGEKNLRFTSPAQMVIFAISELAESFGWLAQFER